MRLKFLSLVITALLITIGLSQTKIIESLENQTFDLRQIAFAPATEASKDIVMIWLDEETMKGLPFRSPVPRDFLTDLNKKILKAKPKLVAYDIFLKDPSFDRDDKALANSLKEGLTYAVMPMRIGACEKGKDGCVDMPLPMFKNALSGVGLADLPFNSFDSVVRKARLGYSTDLGFTPTFAALLYEKAEINSKPLDPRFRGDDASNEMFIRFAGPPSIMGGQTNTFKVFPAHLIIKEIIPSSWLEGKIILVGAAYDDLQDSYLTPYYAGFTNYTRMNGVEVHANILSSLLTKQFYSTPEGWTVWSIIIGTLLLFSLVSTFLSPLKSASILIITMASYTAFTIFSFKNYAYVFPIVLPMGCGLISYGLGIGLRALTEGKQRRWIKSVFSQYVPPVVVEQMMKNPCLVKLGGEERTVTSLFSDIASFTSISEKLDPATLVKFLNDYLSQMNDILFRYGGTIDKYEGDAIIAFFNAPIENKNHELAAANAAIEMKSVDEAVTKKWEGIIDRPITTRIGINTGRAVVGNMGSDKRFDYTAIGDTINLASRLEGTNKLYGTRLMCSEETVRGLNNSIIMRPIDRVRVKGKEKAILLYEIMGKAETETEIETKSKMFTEAFEKFEQRDFTASENLIKEIILHHPDDIPAKILMERITRASSNPTWNLVTELSSK